MQTLVFNSTNRTARLYQGKAEDSEILYHYESVPTLKIEDGYYQIMQTEVTSSEDKRFPVARFPIANTNMLIKK
jgi:hypothetical protein